MKVFILAIAVLLLVTGLVLWESHYVDSTTTALIAAAEQMPSQSIFDKNYAEQNFDTFRLAYANFRQKWDQSKRILYFLAGHSEAERIDSILEEAAVRYLAEDIPAYRSARKRLIAELKKLRDQEKLSFDNFT